VTGYMAGSLALIVASAVVLVVGWTTTEQSLLLASIGASALAAVLMALAYSRSRTLL
jgi:hypothetical protein